MRTKLEMSAVRRWRSSIAFTTLTAFLWSLSLAVPRVARADEPEGEPVAPPEVEKQPPALTAPGPNSPTLPAQIPPAALAPESGAPKPATSDLAKPVETAVGDKYPVHETPGPAPKSYVDGAPIEAKSLPTGADKSGVSSQAISVPQGSGKIQGMGESFSAQLSTGIATFNIPFSLPSARGAAQPSLGLAYSSSGGHGVAGVGWEIGAPFISRQTDRGLPAYADDTDWTPQQDRFVFNGGQELVPICTVAKGGACAGMLSGEVMPSWGDGWQYFRPRVEGSFLRFFWSADHKTWRVQSKSGETMELGVPLDGSGYLGGLEVDPADAKKIFRWSITRHYDAQRIGLNPVNLVTYRYLAIDSRGYGSGYLTDVYDTPPAADPVGATFSAYAHHAHLRYENRPDVTFDYRRGWRTNQWLRLSAVDVTSKTFKGDGPRQLVRRYHLSYDPTYHVSLLTQVQLEGRCGGEGANPAEDAGGSLPTTTGCPTLPAMRLDYQHVAPYTVSGAPGVADLAGYEGFDERIISVANSPDHSLDEEMTDLFDINHDGLPDVVVTAGALYGGNHGVFFNGQGGALNSFGKAQFLSVRGEPGLAGADATTITFKNQNVVAADVDSNGIADLVHMPKVKTYAIYTPQQLFKVDGTPDPYAWEWYGRAVTTASSLSPKIDFGKDGADIRMMDVNGDGLVDAVYSSGTEFQTFFSLGRFQGGYGQFGNAKWLTGTTAAISNDPIRACVPYAGTPVRWSDAEIKVADMNGDHLPDIVKLQKGKIEYWPGRGDGTWGTGDRTACTAGTFSSGTSIVMTTSPYFTDPSVGALRVDDVNGDGLDDLVQIRFDAVDIWLNVDGTGWTDRHVIEGTPASPSYMSRTRLVDMNGSGTRDVLWGDGLNYRFIDLNGGKQPCVLTKVANGLGKTTELEYATSTELMVAAEKDSVAKADPTLAWSKKSPLVQHVVIKETVRDNVSVATRPSGVYVTSYSYRNPAYDGVQREFRGFETTRVTQVGDDNSPTSHAESTFLLGECVPSSENSCEPRDAWKGSPREALKGLPVISETFDDGNAYLQTQHTSYTLRGLYEGRDGRWVKLAFASESDTFLYDNGPYVTSESTRDDLVRVIDEAQGKTEFEKGFRLHSLNGRVRLQSTSAVDMFGNETLSGAYGCVEGCAPVDEKIWTHTTPTLLTTDDSGWLFRTTESYMTGSITTEPRHYQKTGYDKVGNPTDSSAILDGSLPLDRFHAVSGAAVAPAPTTASALGKHEIHLGQTQYDSFGSVTFVTGVNGRCRSVKYDPVYADFAVEESVFVGPPTSVSTIDTSGKTATFICGNLPLVSGGDYDRGLELATKVYDLHRELTTLDYDGFGRVVTLWKPDPDHLGQTSTVPSVKIEYLIGEPVSRMHTSVQDGEKPEDPTYREAWAYVDGLGRTIATLDEADVGAGDAGNWVVNGLMDYDAKSAPRRAFLAWFYSGPPDSFAISSVPPTRFGTKRYDAFGRSLQSYGLDGKTTLFSVYHALTSDAWDAADLAPGPHYGTPASTRIDGHGRTVAVTERVHDASGIEEHETRTDYLPTGETLRISRVRVGKPDASVVRWMQYDSLGRMVRNVEPNTSKNFDPTPSASFAGKAWLYAYDDAGDLVGTSDARGCGTNYIYDSAGRLVGEDYSPCLPHHPAYSAPVFTPGAETGLEVLNRFDYAPGDAAQILAADPECKSYETDSPTIDGALYPGRLTEVLDRGTRTVSVFDGRGRVKCAARQLSKPGVPDDTLAERYAPTWYAQTSKFDGVDRPIVESTGAKTPELLGGDGKSIVKTSYSGRGNILQVSGSYGTLVSNVVHDADGLPSIIHYGDAARTTRAVEYDDKRRLRSVQTYRGTPDIWTSGASSLPSTFQLVLEDLEYAYDDVDNPLEIRDFRDPKEWLPGSKPVTRKFQYDDLYRVTVASYQYASGDDNWVSPFAAENDGSAKDPRQAKPSPHVAFDKRVLWQSYRYDWLGNSINSSDDANGFYDRSLGTIANGAANDGPYQLKSATSAPGPRAGALTAKYDDAGYLTSLAVRRDGPCLPASPEKTSCSARFVYDWDEVGRLQRARRWDLATVGLASDPEPSAMPAADLRYQYNAGDQRTRKTAADPATGEERHTLYVFASLEVRRATWVDSDYQRNAYTDVPYVFARGVRLARIAYEDADVPSAVSTLQPRLHVFLEIADHLGSTSTVVDLQTSELVEKSTYLATGGTDSDYRPARWKSFREDNRFTGKEEDIEIGLEYFGHRYLSPALGRWISADPLVIHGMGADPNAYAYVRGRLLIVVDPTGLDGFWSAAKDLLVTTASLIPTSPIPAVKSAQAMYGAIKEGVQTGSVMPVVKQVGENAVAAIPIVGTGMVAIKKTDEAAKHFAVAVDAAKHGDTETAKTESIRGVSATIEAVDAGVKTGFAIGAEAGGALGKVGGAKSGGTAPKGAAAAEAEGATARPCNCLAAGTLVATASGWVPIQEIQVGDLVWSVAEDGTSGLELKQVEFVFVRPAREVVEVDLRWSTTKPDLTLEFGRYLSDRNGVSSLAELISGLSWETQTPFLGANVSGSTDRSTLRGRLIATLDHPFRTEHGWSPLGAISAGGTLWAPGSGRVSLGPGDRSPVSSRTVYNLRVRDFHTYFVAAPWPLWVHNDCVLTEPSHVDGTQHASAPPKGSNTVRQMPQSELVAPPKARGRAPTGKDGHPIELHHEGQQPDSPLVEMTRTDHRGPGNFAKNHENTGQAPSAIDRKAFKAEREGYFKSQWDAGKYGALNREDAK